MGRETLEVSDERDALKAQLARVERAYDDLLGLVRRYEQEREEIKGRLRRLLIRIGAGDPG
jgi:hypothetical protein